MADNKVQIDIVGKDQASPAFTQVQQSIKGMNSQADQASVAFQKMGAFAVASVAGFSAGAMISQLLEAGKAAERLSNSFAAATGSISAGAASLAYVRAEAQRLGLDLQSAADGYMKISAASRGTQLEGANTQAIFRSVAGASTALGLSSEQTNGALLAISQMMSKGTVQAEELRGQLGERLPGAFQIAARAMGVSTSELGKMLETGKVIAEDFLPKFAAELEKTFPPSEKATSSLTAETNRLKTAWFELNATVMASGGEGMFSGAIRGMRSLTEEAAAFVRTIGKTDSRFLSILMPGVMYASGKASGAIDSNKPLESLNRTDNLLLSQLGNGSTGVGPSGGASYLLGSGANIFAPSVPIPNASKEAIDAYAKRQKELQRQQPRLKLAGDADGMLETRRLAMEQQEKDFYELGQEMERSWKSGAAVFNLGSMQPGNLSTSRYNVTNPLNQKGLTLFDGDMGPNLPSQSAGYRLDSKKQYSIPQAGPAIDPEAAQKRARILQNIQVSTPDQYGNTNGFEDRNSATAEMLAAYKNDEEMKTAILAKNKAEQLAIQQKFDDNMLQSQFAAAEKAAGLMLQIAGDNKAAQLVALGVSTSIAIAQIQIQGRVAQMMALAQLGPIAGAAAAAQIEAMMWLNTGLTAAAGVVQMAKLDGARASGGPVLSGASYLVGERGPEIFTPGASGQITSNDKLANLGGSGFSVTQVLQITAGVPEQVRSEINRMGPMIQSLAVSAVKQAMRSGTMSPA